MDVDVGTRAILKLVLLPPGILLLLLFVGWIFARRFFGRFLILLGTIACYALSAPALVDLLARQVETVPALTPTQLHNSRADAILVFLADSRRHNPELGGADALGPMSLERVDYALRLHRKTGLPIMLSGGRTEDDGPSLAQMASAWLRQQAGVTTLAVEGQSRDTRENATASAKKLQRLGIDRVLLVTHAFHMPRAMLSARDARIDAVPAPFGFRHVPPELQEPGEITDWLPHPGVLGRSYLMLHEIAGLVWYGLNPR
jgi:uncharacterized SAM-binding protein YcdF (DUF218 family)